MTDHAVTIAFPQGLRPQVFADLAAVLDNRPTLWHLQERANLATARRVMLKAAEACGLTGQQALDVSHLDEHELGYNFEALLNVIFERLARLEHVQAEARNVLRCSALPDSWAKPVADALAKSDEPLI